MLYVVLSIVRFICILSRVANVDANNQYFGYLTKALRCLQQLTYICKVSWILINITSLFLTGFSEIIEADITKWVSLYGT